MVKLVITDMDGTLVNRQDELPADLFHRIEQLKEKGVRFAIASGRQYYNLEKRFWNIKDDIIVIAENGAMIFDHGKRIYTDEIAYEDVAHFVELLRCHPENYVVLCGSESAYIETTDEAFYKKLLQFYERVEVVEDLLEIAKKDVICKLAIFNERSAEEEIYPLLKAYEDQFMLAVSGNFWMDIMKKGINKGTAITKIQQLYQIKPQECMAFGDYLNDYEMMQVCEYSYAMANAHPKLKEICKYEAKSNDENGVVEELIRFFELEKQYENQANRDII